ncbi:hypothetical protein [Bacillus sp. AFS001701]|nr:hypothetical protein [Bacillus sp. AFS001701]
MQSLDEKVTNFITLLRNSGIDSRSTIEDLFKEVKSIEKTPIDG